MLMEMTVRYGTTLPAFGKSDNEKFLVDGKLYAWHSESVMWIRVSVPKVHEVYYDYPEKGIATVEIG